MNEYIHEWDMSLMLKRDDKNWVAVAALILYNTYWDRQDPVL